LFAVSLILVTPDKQKVRGIHFSSLNSSNESERGRALSNNILDLSVESPKNIYATDAFNESVRCFRVEWRGPGSHELSEQSYSVSQLQWLGLDSLNSKCDSDFSADISNLRER
jgi:hypothetical protein